MSLNALTRFDIVCDTCGGTLSEDTDWLEDTEAAAEAAWRIDGAIVYVDAADVLQRARKHACAVCVERGELVVRAAEYRITILLPPPEVLPGQGDLLAARVCRVCGCTDGAMCAGGCAWRLDDGRGPCCTACDPTTAANTR